MWYRTIIERSGLRMLTVLVQRNWHYEWFFFKRAQISFIIRTKFFFLLNVYTDDHQCRGWGVLRLYQLYTFFPTILFLEILMWKTHGFWLGQKLGYLTLYKLSSGWLFVLCLKNIFVMKANILFLKREIKAIWKCYIKKWKHLSAFSFPRSFIFLYMYH